MLSFSSMSNSLSHSAAKTMRPTNVRASVGSSTSGSSARPKRSVCARRRAASRGQRERRANRAERDEVMSIHRCPSRHASVVMRESASSVAGTAAQLGAAERRLQRLEPRIARAAAAVPARIAAARRDLAPEMARHRVAVARRRAAALLGAARPRMRAARAETAARRRVARDSARRLRAGSRRRLQRRLGHRDRRQQRLRVRVARRREERALVRVLDDLPRYITATRVGDVLDHREIVRDEDVGKSEPRAAGRAAG